MTTSNPVPTLALPVELVRELPVAPLFDPATMSSDKAGIAALKAFGEEFEKACPNHAYDFTDSLKFHIVIPFKDLIGQATEAEKKDLELYNKHQELCGSIEKVKGAFKDYLSAAEAVKEVSLRSLEHARKVEKDMGKALVESYQALINLAKRNGGSGQKLLAFLDDTQDALKKATRSMGNVYYTVHMLRTRIYVRGNELWNAIEEPLPKPVKDRFLEYVIDYSDRIKPQALSERGTLTEEYEKDFDAAFKEGLASVPGLQPPDVELFKSQLIVAQEDEQYYIKMLNEFNSEINLFINGEKNTISAQYRSLFLESFITGAQIDDLRGVREQLKQIKTLRSQRDAMDKEFRETQQKIISLEAALNAKTEHTVGELLAFVRSSLQDDRKPYIYDDNKALQGLVKIEEEIAKQIELSVQKIADLKESIQEKKKALATLVTAFQQRVAIEKSLEDLIKREKAQLEIDEKAHNENIANLARERVEGPNARQTWEKMSAAQAAYAEKLKKSVEQLREFQQKQESIQEELKQHGEKIKTLEKEIEIDEKIVRESENVGHPDVRNDLQLLRELQEARANDTVEITGNDLITMADFLAILERKGTLGYALKEAKENAAEAKSLELKQKELEASYRTIEEQIDTTQFPNWVIDQDGSLMINDNFYLPGQCDDMRQAMSNKLDTAIEKSRKAHKAVAKKKAELYKQVLKKKGKNLTGLEQEAVLQKLARSVEKRSAQDVKAIPVESEDEEAMVPVPLSPSADGLEEASVVLPPAAMTPAPAIGTTGLSVVLVEDEDKAKPAPAPKSSSGVSAWFRRNLGPDRPAAPDYDPKRQPTAPTSLLGRLNRLFIQGPAAARADVSKAAGPVAPLPEATPAVAPAVLAAAAPLPAAVNPPVIMKEGDTIRYEFAEM